MIDQLRTLGAEISKLSSAVGALTAQMRAQVTAAPRGTLDAEAATLLDWLRDNVGTGTLFCASEIAPDLGYTDANELGRQLARLEHRGLIRAGRGQDGVLWLLSV